MADKRILYSPPDFPEKKLSDEATRTRRNLIAAMAIWVLIVMLELTPEKIVPLDINLKNSPISIPTITTWLLIYFWMSFVIYAYKDWIRWVHAFQGAIAEHKRKKEDQLSDISDAIKAIEHAKQNGIQANQGISIKFATRGNEIGNSMAAWEGYIPAWRADYDRHCRRCRQLWIDVILRSLWDYILPSALILGPAYYFIKVIGIL